MAALFSVTGYLGINFVLVLVRSFGVLMAVTGVHVHVYAELLRIFILYHKWKVACMIPYAFHAKCICVRNSKLKPVASKH